MVLKRVSKAKKLQLLTPHLVLMSQFYLILWIIKTTNAKVFKHLMLKCLDLSPSDAEKMYLKRVLKDEDVTIS